MKCLRIYATPDGESHFDEIDIPTDKRPVSPEIAPFELSAHYPASRRRCRQLVAWRSGSWTPLSPTKMGATGSRRPRKATCRPCATSNAAASICHPGNGLRTWYRHTRRLARPSIALAALARRSSRSFYGLQKRRREKLERLRLENLVMLAGKTHDI